MQGAWSWIAAGVFFVTSVILSTILARRLVEYRCICGCQAGESRDKCTGQCFTAPQPPSQAAPSSIPLAVNEDKADSRCAEPRLVYIDEERNPVYINEDRDAVYINEGEEDSTLYETMAGAI